MISNLRKYKVSNVSVNTRRGCSRKPREEATSLASLADPWPLLLGRCQPAAQAAAGGAAAFAEVAVQHVFM